MDHVLSQDRVDHLRLDYEQGFISFCGFKAGKINHGRFDSSVEIKGHHRQQDGFIHAGVMATMADHTAGYAAFTIVDPSFQILSIEFKINFMKPAFGEGLECMSKVIREGRTIIVAESEVFDVREGMRVLTAKAMVTLMAVDRQSLISQDKKR